MVVIARLVLTDCQFGVRASDPMQLEMNCRRTVCSIGDDLLQHGTQDAFLQRDRRVGMVPELLQVVSKCEQLFPLFRRDLRRRNSGIFEMSFHLCKMTQSVVPSLLELGSNKAVLRFRGLILALGTSSFIASLLKRELQRAPLLTRLALTGSSASKAALIPTGRSASRTSAAIS